MIYNSAMRDEAVGAIDYDTDSFFVMLVDSSYSPDRKNHKKRSDITGEIVGDGYTSGGVEVVVSLQELDADDKVEITLGGNIWSPATITARGAVYYKNNGGSPADDELVYYNDFETDISSTNAAFTLSESMIRKQNT